MTKPILRAARVFLAALVLLAVLWTIGLVWFMSGLGQPTADPDRVTDAIIVLTGGSLRIESGVELLADGKAKKLFISGVHPGIETPDELHLPHGAPGWTECCIVLGHAADNTVGNALELAEWLKRENYHSIRLVTASYHMKRALLEFRRILPPDIEIIAHPVFPPASHADGFSIFSSRPGRVVLVEYLKYLGALVRPLLPASLSRSEAMLQ